jgi:hypothetical protein
MSQPSSGRPRVMAMNGPDSPDRDRRHRLLAGTIRDLRPDVVALQEVPVDVDGDPGRIIGRDFHIAPFSRSGDGVGGVVATRWPHRFESEREEQALLVARASEEYIGSRDVHALVEPGGEVDAPRSEGVATLPR